MLYYYLDGLDKKGPYSAEELRVRNLNPDTLVFSEGMDKWVHLKDIPSLYEIVYPTIAEAPSTDQLIENQVPKEKIHIQKKKLKIPSFIFLIIGIFLAIGISYFVIKNQQSKDYGIIQKKIAELMQNKDEICDYEHSGVIGKSILIPDTVNVLDNESKRLIEYYRCDGGGFTIKTLTKKNNGYDIVTTYSKNMGYKIPAKRYTAGSNYGYGVSTPGFYTSTYRQTVQEAYDGAMRYLSSDKENKSYTPGTYGKIKSFDELFSDFYYLDNIAPTRYSSDSPFSKSWESSSDGYVFNNEWMVWYSYKGEHYEILENSKAFSKRWLYLSLIMSSASVVIYLLIIYRNRIGIQIT